MNQGVREAVIETKDQSILLLRQVHSTTSEEYYVPKDNRSTTDATAFLDQQAYRANLH